MKATTENCPDNNKYFTAHLTFLSANVWHYVVTDNTQTSSYERM